MTIARIIKFVIWGLVLGGFVWWASQRLAANKAILTENSQLAQIRNTEIPVVTTTVGTATLEGNFEVTGNFKPYQEVAIMSEAAGKIIQLNFDNGTSVQAGAVLARIDHDLLQIQLETAKTNLAKAESDFARLSNLLGDGGVTQQQIEDAKIGIENIKLNIRSLNKQLTMSQVIAPISGVISDKMVEKGSLIAPAMQLGKITNISRLKMQVYLTEEQIFNVKKGQKIPLKSDLFADKKFDGVVTFVDVNAGSSRRFLVEIEIPNTNGNLKAGMTGTAFFSGGATREVVAVPRESIVGSLQDAKVYVVEGTKAILRNVNTSTIFGDKVQITNGLKVGETIVISGQINLEDGMNIQLAAQ